MITFPNAKINLGLRITSKRSDGYHNLETVFYPVPVCDALEIVPALDGEEQFTLSGITLDGNPNDNLVVKAYHLLKNDFNLPPVNIYLRKNIPFGAGLGGGSSDGAFMLKLLDEYASLNLSSEELEIYAAKLGADCPFFIKNKPVFAEGTGNEFSAIDLSLQGYFLVLVKPDIFVSTKEAFSGIVPAEPATSLKEIIRMPIEEWKNYMFNDFEKNIFLHHPEIEQIKSELYNLGALYASMSGSGSSVFGIFDSRPDWKPKNSNSHFFIIPLNF